MFNIVPNRGALNITFWNPYDDYNATLTNRRQTLTSIATGVNRWVGGWENLEISSGKVYFELEIEQLDVNGVNNAMVVGWRNSQDGFSANATATDTTRVIYLGPDCHQVALWNSDIGTKIQGSNTLTTTNTNEYGYAEGDTLMFAMDFDNGKAWVGKNGTWMNSGDPAAGTGAQWTGFLSGRSYRFFAEGFGFTNAIINARFGGTIFPQEYSEPSGFTALVPPAENQVYGGWNIRSSSAEWQHPTDDLTDDNFTYGSKLLTSGSSQRAASVGRMREGEKFYFEAWTTVEAGGVVYEIGVAPTGNSVASCFWRNDGTLHTTGGISSDSTGVVAYSDLERIALAVDVDAGKIWLRKPGGDWTNSGNPAAGTNAQFTNVTVTELVAFALISSYSGTWQLVNPANYLYATPSGFTTGLPLHPLGLQ